MAWYAWRSAEGTDIAEGKYGISACVASQIVGQPEKHRTVITLKDVKADGVPLAGKMRLYVYSLDIDLETDDEIFIDQGKITYPRGYNNPGGFDFASYLKTDGVFLCASANAEDIHLVQKHATLKRLLSRLRSRLSDTTDRVFGSESDVMKAILLGDRSGIDEKLYDSFSASGISHLIALSGLHVSAIAIMLEWLLRKIRLPRPVRYIITIVMLLLYAIMTGGGKGTVRAVIMYALLCASMLAGYRSDTLTRLSQAFLIQLTVNPLLIRDRGFVLSYASVASILSLGWKSSNAKGVASRFLNTVFQSAKASFSVQVLTYPLLMSMFCAVPLLSVPINMLCVPIGMLALFAGFVLLCTGCIWTPLAAALSLPIRGIWQGIKALSAWVAKLSFSSLSTGPWNWIEITLFVCAAVFGSVYMSRNRNRRTAGLTAIILIVFWTLLPSEPLDHLRITFLDVGSADAAVIDAEGHVYAVDCGGENSVEADYMVSQRSALAGIFLTHPDTDHYGGVYEVLKRYPGTAVYLPDCWDEMEVPEELTSALQGKRVTYLCAGDTVELSKNAAAEVLWPPEGYLPKSDNDGSLVLLISYAGRSVLMAGDVTDAVDVNCASPADILRVAHHGSKYATSAAFLDIVRPANAIISVGNNAHGHPTEETLGRLRDIGSTVYRTDRAGAVFVDIYKDGEYEIRTFLSTED